MDTFDNTAMMQYDTDQLSLAISKADAVLGNRIAIPLRDMEIEPFPEKLKKLKIEDATWLFKLDRFSVKHDAKIEEKLTNVIKAIHLSGATLIALMRFNQGEVSYYLGTVNKSGNSGELISMKNVLESGLKGNFPGTSLSELDVQSVADEINDVFGDDFETQCVTSISGAASARTQDKEIKESIRGIENMVDSIGDTSFSLLVVADSISSGQLCEIRSGYENLATQLSLFQKVNFSEQKGENSSVSESTSDSFSQSVSNNVSKTQSFTKQNGWSVGAIDDYGKHSTARIAGHALSAAGSVIGAVVGVPFIGGGISAVTNTIFGGNATASESTAETTQEGETTQKGTSHQEGKSTTSGTSESKTVSLYYENYTVKNLLRRIDESLKMIDEASTYGAYQCAAYVLSSNASTNMLVASQYHSLMCGSNTTLQMTDINTWTGGSKVTELKKYLSHFTHPLFKGQGLDDLMSPAVMVGSSDLAYHIGLPHKSVRGLPVTEFEAFGRSVSRFDRKVDNSDKTILLGNIFHMGEADEQSVRLNLKSLAMHSFVTGSTGSGKSNTVYQLLRELVRKNIGFLIVEPAKGEYKQVFGHLAHVYGTNPYITPLLKINPFRFPAGIHVLEHIDRLVEIFNVCWPMYAAMPAVLKESVERAYVDSGWDLLSSTNSISESLFPTFADVLHELNIVVQESSFSQEVKDNYSGSLVTRVKSLTNGIYGRIFSNNELGDKQLFDDNVIVDLSRVGSVETKAMIMGILVMRLQEYRITSGKMNADLKHVTVLEEAHNLLKRTSTEQSGESSNLLGKSVEMLSNIIAEVRTYGEGFIIADQAPGLLDMSVIRNTNTKIIMRLPDEDDRRLVGKAANLTDSQIKELAKLPTGVAAIYQNDWLEPVLCKVAYESTDALAGTFDRTDLPESDCRADLLTLLYNKMSGKRIHGTLAEISDLIISAPLPAAVRARILTVFEQHGKLSEKEGCQIIHDIACNYETEKTAENVATLDEWRDCFVNATSSPLKDMDTDMQNVILECIIKAQIVRYGKPESYVDKWRYFVREDVS